MAAVCETEAYGDRIKANPKHRDTLMAIDPAEFIETLQKLRALFVAGANLNVMGMTDAELDSITAPTIVIPGNDNTHAYESAGNAHRLIPGGRITQFAARISGLLTSCLLTTGNPITARSPRPSTALCKRRSQQSRL